MTLPARRMATDKSGTGGYEGGLHGSMDSHGRWSAASRRHISCGGCPSRLAALSG